MSQDKKPIWEDFITLNSGKEPRFSTLPPAREHLETDGRLQMWSGLDYAGAVSRDGSALPETADREGYYGPNHFSYWASGLQDMQYLLAAAAEFGNDVTSFLDIGCASGRVARHFLHQHPEIQVFGCDLNRFHVEWCSAHLPAHGVFFQNHSIPALPLEDASLDLVSAFSVFTHIEALETAWLMEIRRVLRPGGIAWITVHTEHTLSEMTPDWPIWKPVMSHPSAGSVLDAARGFAGDRLVFRWHGDRSYASNVFYRTAYLQKTWGRIMEIVDLCRCFPNFQDVLIMRKA